MLVHFDINTTQAMAAQCLMAVYITRDPVISPWTYFPGHFSPDNSPLFTRRRTFPPHRLRRLLTIKCMSACFVNVTAIYELYILPTLKGECPRWGGELPINSFIML